MKVIAYGSTAMDPRGIPIKVVHKRCRANVDRAYFATNRCYHSWSVHYGPGAENHQLKDRVCWECGKGFKA